MLQEHIKVWPSPGRCGNPLGGVAIPWVTQQTDSQSHYHSYSVGQQVSIDLFVFRQINISQLTPQKDDSSTPIHLPPRLHPDTPPHPDSTPIHLSTPQTCSNGEHFSEISTDCHLFVELRRLGQIGLPCV